ncbi:hypothetical protein GH733_007824 [Mirounga leonina]|nr:hypothetical protein GH733_007824 [Mirounga leonina]
MKHLPLGQQINKLEARLRQAGCTDDKGIRRKDNEHWMKEDCISCMCKVSEVLQHNVLTPSTGAEAGDGASFGPGCGPAAHVHFAAVVLPGAEPYTQLVALHHPRLHNVSGHPVYVPLQLLEGQEQMGLGLIIILSSTSTLRLSATSNRHVVCHWPLGATYSLAILLRKTGVTDKLSFQSDLEAWELPTLGARDDCIGLLAV